MLDKGSHQRRVTFEYLEYLVLLLRGMRASEGLHQLLQCMLMHGRLRTNLTSNHTRLPRHLCTHSHPWLSLMRLLLLHQLLRRLLSRQVRILLHHRIRLIPAKKRICATVDRYILRLTEPTNQIH